AFAWDLRTTTGAAAIAKRFEQARHAVAPRNVQLAGGRTPPRTVTRAGTACLEVIFAFETTVGPCNGVVRLITEDGQPRACTLMIDRDQRVGDSWRKRYHALTLHNETRVNHFPYMPFPRSWPVFIPKDMLANWFELYCEAMELNVWTGTELVAADHDDATKRW